MLFRSKIPNWDGLSRQMSEPKWTQSKLRQTFQRLSSTTEGEAKVGKPTGIIVSMGKVQTDRTLLERRIGKDRAADRRNLSHETMEISYSFIKSLLKLKIE